MKIHVQFTPLLTAALLCAAGWFALWLFAFRPALPRTAIPAPHPEVTRLVTDDETLRKLKTPTLFALPSDAGFSGKFLEPEQPDLSLEKTNSPARYLSAEKTASPGVDRSLLTTEAPFPKSELPAPGSLLRPAVRPVAGTQLVLSPALTVRANESLRLDIAATNRPETVRVNLAVRADGTIEYAFFETPATNVALLRAVRQLQFNPAKEKTEGWIDIRFTQEDVE